MIGYADKSMIPVLKKMWKACFGDEDAYIDFYFEKRFREDNVLVYLDEEGAPASMLSLLPAELVLGGNKTIKVRYIYAGATFPEHRRKGYYSRLLEYALNSAEAAKEAVMLLPADEKLREYYKKEGFADAFCWTKNIMNITRPALTTMEIQEDFEILDISPEEYKELRDACFYREGYICWDLEALRYAAEETVFCGGEFHKLSYQGKEYGVLYYIEDGRLYVKEITAHGEEAERVIKRLACYLGVRSAESVTEAGNTHGAEKSAMLSKGPESLACGYFNLSLG